MIYRAFVAMKCSETRLSDILAEDVINGLNICKAVNLCIVFFSICAGLYNSILIVNLHEWESTYSIFLERVFYSLT